MTAVESNDNELLVEIEKLHVELAELHARESEARRRSEDLVMLTAIASAMNQSLELQEVVDTALEESMAVLDLDAGLICLFDSATQTFVPASFRGVSDQVVAVLTGFKKGDGLSGEIGQISEPLIIADMTAMSEDPFPEATREGLPFYAGLPISGAGGLLGVMILLGSKPGCIAEDRLGLLADIGDQIGRALTNARLYRQTKQEIVDRLVAERQRLRLVKQLQMQVRQLHRLADGAPAALLLLDDSGRIILANSVAEEEMAELIGAEQDEVLAEIGGISLADLVRAPGDGQPHVLEADGRRFEIDACRIDTADPAHELERRVLVIRDVTATSGPPSDRRQGQAGTSCDQMAAGFAQHLDSSLAVIGLYAGTMLMNKSLPTELHEGLQIIDDQARRAGALIGKVLDFGQGMAPGHRPMDLLPLVRALAGDLERILPESVRVEFEHADDAYVVKGDPIRLRQVVLNLAQNSADAMPEGGHLRLALRRQDDSTPEEARWPGIGAGNWVQLTVTDDGAGIAPDVLPRIFDPFFTTNPAGTAAGLGLSQLHGIVTQLGGGVDLRSEVGGGTTFAIHLPAVVTHGSEPAADATPKRGDDQTVVVVENDDELRNALVDSLQELGYRAIKSADAGGLATTLETSLEDVSVVLVGAHPKEGDDPISRELMQRFPDVDFVLMTRERSDAESLEEQGWSGWLEMPAQLDRLAQVLHEVTSMRP